MRAKPMTSRPTTPTAEGGRMSKVASAGSHELGPKRSTHILHPLASSPGMPMRRQGPVALFVLLLAVASLGLVFYQAYASLDAQQQRTVQLVEYGIIALFALEFLFGLVRHRHRVAYLLRNWYELLALVP